VPDFSKLPDIAIAGIIVFSVMETIKALINYARITYMRKSNGGHEPVEEFFIRLERIEKKISNMSRRLSYLERSLAPKHKNSKSS
jgi:hypothetical protein